MFLEKGLLSDRFLQEFHQNLLFHSTLFNCLCIVFRFLWVMFQELEEMAESSKKTSCVILREWRLLQQVHNFVKTNNWPVVAQTHYFLPALYLQILRINAIIIIIIINYYWINIFMSCWFKFAICEFFFEFVGWQLIFYVKAAAGVKALK